MLFFNETEDKLFIPFMDYVDNHPKEKLILEWTDGTKLLTRLDTAYDSMNDLDEEDEGFEEYFACAMETVKIISIGTAPVCDFEVGGLFEVNYHNFPDFVRDQDGNILLEKSVLLRQ